MAIPICGWDPNGTVISSSNSATLSLEGIYTLIATVGSCDIVMEITVRYQVSLVIPNVISPNMDGLMTMGNSGRICI